MTLAAGYNLELRNLEEIQSLAWMLARHFPDPEASAAGIHELLLNAVEHGNLGIGFAAKTELLRRGEWRTEIARRLLLPQNAGKTVAVRLTRDAIACRLTIADRGEGFRWQDQVSRPPCGRRPNGRGLWIARHGGFDRLLFSPSGNEVTCVAEYRPRFRAALHNAA